VRAGRAGLADPPARLNAMFYRRAKFDGLAYAVNAAGDHPSSPTAIGSKTNNASAYRRR